MEDLEKKHLMIIRENRYLFVDENPLHNNNLPILI